MSNKNQTIQNRSSEKPYVRVAVGVLVREDGAVLLSSRPADKPWPLWWELAGGKIENDETPLDALQRELNEELGIEVDYATPWIKYVHHYSVNTVELSFYLVNDWEGEPTPLENQQVAWYIPGEPMDVAIGPVLPATFPILRWLQLPEQYLISQINSPAGVAPWLQHLKTALEEGVGMVQFREPSWQGSEEELFDVLQQTVALCDQYGAYCLLNSVHPMEWVAHTDGLHLRSADAIALLANDQRPDLRADQWLAVSTHNEQEIEAAQALKSDFIVLGHVLATASHPGVPGMGWDRFHALAAEAGRPVYAIGGQSEWTLGSALMHGGHGIAEMWKIPTDSEGKGDSTTDEEDTDPVTEGAMRPNHRDVRGHGPLGDNTSPDSSSINNEMDRVSISEHEGVRYLHLSSPWVQGAMRLNAPNELELEYTQQMMMWQLFQGKEQPKNILQLGLGAGSLSKFCYLHYPQSTITVVDLNPEVVNACWLLFDLPNDSERLPIVQSCALEHLKQCPSGSVDVLQVDLYSSWAEQPALESQEFYDECARVLSNEGLFTVNILGNQWVHARNLHRLQQSFAAVAWLPETHDGNIVAIGFKNPPSVDFSQLYEKAHELTKQYGLPAAQWVQGLEEWMQGD